MSVFEKVGSRSVAVIANAVVTLTDEDYEFADAALGNGADTSFDDGDCAHDEENNNSTNGEEIIVKDCGKAKRAYRFVAGELRMFNSNFGGNTGHRHRRRNRPNAGEHSINLTLFRRNQDRILSAMGHDDWLIEREEQANDGAYYDSDEFEYGHNARD